MKIYDITVPLSAATTVYPGDPAVEVFPHSRISAGGTCNVDRISLSSHSGTHVDAPRHFIDNGMTVDRIPIGNMVGEAAVADVTGVGRIGPRDLQRVPAEPLMILLKTREDSPSPGFDAGHPFLTEEAARLLIRRGITLIGIDTPSVEENGGDGSVHRLLLDNGIVILEGIDLSRVTPGTYELVCLPLPIAGSDGAPARAILIDRGDSSGLDPHTTRWPLA
jgi:arylformamidase